MSGQASGDVREAIAAVNRQLAAAFGRGDAAAVAAFYTRDAKLIPTGSDFVTGTQAIQAFWQAVLGAGVGEVTLESLEVEAHGDTAHEVGRYVLRGGGQVVDQGKYVVIWKREGGQWKLHRDIWNSSLSPA